MLARVEASITTFPESSYVHATTTLAQTFAREKGLFCIPAASGALLLL